MIALLCSMPFEAEALTSALRPHASFKMGLKTFHQGTLANREVTLCAGGMGKTNAAHAATLLIARCAADALIIFGIGGAFPSSDARIGDIALATEEIAGDEGVETKKGFQDTKFIGIPLVPVCREPIFNNFPASPHLLKNAQNALTSRSSPVVRMGKFVTLSTCTGTRSRARELEERYGALCENMEGAAAAQVAALHGIPWVEVRGISNIVEERDLEHWDLPKASEAVQSAVECILAGWKE